MVDIPVVAGDFLQNFKVEGGFNLTRNFEDYLTISNVQVIAEVEERTAVKAALSKGSYHTFLGYPVRIHSTSERCDFEHNLYIFTVEFKHALAPLSSEIRSQLHPLDEKIVVVDVMDADQRVDLSTIADYTGVQNYLVPFDNPDSELTVTPRSLLDKYKRRLNANGGFVYWSDPSATPQPEFKPWARTTEHTVKHLGQELNFSEPGQGAVIDGVQLVSEGINLEFVPDEDTEEGKFDICQLGPIKEPKGGADRVYSSDYDEDAFKSSGIWFDTGGPVKERITPNTCNGEPLSIRTEKWGFIGSSIGAVLRPSAPQIGSYDFIRTHDIKEVQVTDGDGNTVTEYQIFYLGISSLVIQGAWQKFYDVTKTFTWGEDRYRRKITESGWILYRYKQESNLSTIKLVIADKELDDKFAEDSESLTGEALTNLTNEYNRNKEIIKKKIELEAGFRIIYIKPEDNFTKDELGNLGAYYGDLQPTKQEPYKYSMRRVEQRNYFVSTPDPESEGADLTLDEKPRITYGERYYKEEITDILNPVSRRDTRGIERYSKITKQSNSQGTDFKDQIEISPTEFSQGRPDGQVRRDYYGKEANPFPKPANAENASLILNTPGTGYTSADPIQGNYSSPGVVTNEQAKEAFELDYSIANTDQAKTTDIETDTNLNIVEGDRLKIDDPKFLNQKYIVFSVSINDWKIHQAPTPFVRSEVMSLGIGFLISFGPTWVLNNPTLPPENAPEAVTEETLKYLQPVEPIRLELDGDLLNWVSPVNTRTGVVDLTLDGNNLNWLTTQETLNILDGDLLNWNSLDPTRTSVVSLNLNGDLLNWITPDLTRTSVVNVPLDGDLLNWDSILNVTRTGTHNFFFKANLLFATSPDPTRTSIADLVLNGSLLNWNSPNLTRTSIVSLNLDGDLIDWSSPDTTRTSVVDLPLDGDLLNWNSPDTTRTSITNLDLNSDLLNWNSPDTTRTSVANLNLEGDLLNWNNDPL